VFVERDVRGFFRADVEEDRRDPAAGGLRRFRAHVLVVRIVDAEVAVRVDDARHEHESVGVDHAFALWERVVRTDGDDPALVRGDATLEFRGVCDYARTPNHEIRLHRPSSIVSIVLHMPSHWLFPTVTGARLPSPRAQIALRPSSTAAARSTLPGGAARSITTASGGNSARTSAPTIRAGTVEKSSARSCVELRSS